MTKIASSILTAANGRLADEVRPAPASPSPSTERGNEGVRF